MNTKEIKSRIKENKLFKERVIHGGLFSSTSSDFQDEIINQLNKDISEDIKKLLRVGSKVNLESIRVKSIVKGEVVHVTDKCISIVSHKFNGSETVWNDEISDRILLD